MLDGVGEIVAAVSHFGNDTTIFEGITTIIVGGCLIYYSNRLAILFCKGLDDE